MPKLLKAAYMEHSFNIRQSVNVRTFALHTVLTRNFVFINYPKQITGRPMGRLLAFSGLTTVSMIKQIRTEE